MKLCIEDLDSMDERSNWNDILDIVEAWINKYPWELVMEPISWTVYVRNVNYTYMDTGDI